MKSVVFVQNPARFVWISSNLLKKSFKCMRLALDVELSHPCPWTGPPYPRTDAKGFLRVAVEDALRPHTLERRLGPSAIESGPPSRFEHKVVFGEIRSNEFDSSIGRTYCFQAKMQRQPTGSIWSDVRRNMASRPATKMVVVGHHLPCCCTCYFWLLHHYPPKLFWVCTIHMSLPKFVIFLISIGYTMC